MEFLQDLVHGVPFELAAQLAAGAVGGTAAGGMLRRFSLGPAWNAVAGILGGGAGAQAFLHLGMMPGAASEIEALGTQAASGAIGGALLLVLIGLVRSMARH